MFSYAYAYCRRIAMKDLPLLDCSGMLQFCLLLHYTQHVDSGTVDGKKFATQTHVNEHVIAARDSPPSPLELNVAAERVLATRPCEPRKFRNAIHEHCFQH